MTMTMIEIVARASHTFFQPVYNLTPWEALPQDAKHTALAHAKACIEAMSAIKPPMEVHDAGLFYCTEGTDPDRVWKAMLDASVAQ